MNNDDSEFWDDILGTSRPHGTYETSTPQSETLEESRSAEVQQGLEGGSENDSLDLIGLENRTETDSYSSEVRSHFSDSSSGSEPSPIAETNLEQATLYDALRKLSGNAFDDDGDDALNIAVRKHTLEPQALARLEAEEASGYKYALRPRSPLRPRGDDDFYRPSARWYRGQSLNGFDKRNEPLSRYPKGPSPLRSVKSADDLSPTSRIQTESRVGDEILALEELTDHGDDTEMPESMEETKDDVDRPLESDEDNGQALPALSPAPSNQAWSGTLVIRQHEVAPKLSGTPVTQIIGVSDEPIQLDDLEAQVEELENGGVVSNHATSTTLAINTAFNTDGAKQPPRTSGTFAEEVVKDDPPTPTSAEELEFMTEISPGTAEEKLRELYREFQASSWPGDPAKTLHVKRQLVDYLKRRLPYNGLDDDTSRELKGMYTDIAAHLARRQRDEWAWYGKGEHEKLEQAERMLMEDEEQIGTLKHAIEKGEESLKQKKLEANGWKTAYDKVAQIARAEWERKERQRTAGTQTDVTDSVETETERVSMQSSGTQTLTAKSNSLSSQTEGTAVRSISTQTSTPDEPGLLSPPLLSPPSDERAIKLRKSIEELRARVERAKSPPPDVRTTPQFFSGQLTASSNAHHAAEKEASNLAAENERLKSTIADLSKSLQSTRSRNNLLEDRIGASNEAWFTLTDTRVDVGERAKYISGLEDEVRKLAPLEEENLRSKKMLVELKTWHEEQEQISREVTQAMAERRRALLQLAQTPADINPLQTEPRSPRPGRLEKKERWKQREAEMRNTESWKQNLEVARLQFAMRREEREKALADEEDEWDAYFEKQRGFLKGRVSEVHW